MVKNPPVCAGDLRDTGLAPGSGRSPGEGNGNPLQCSCLENSMHRGAWWATVHGVTQSRIQLKQLSSMQSKDNKRQKLLQLPLSRLYYFLQLHTHTHTHTHTGPLILLQSHILLSCYLNASRVCHLSPAVDYKFQNEDSIVQQKHMGFRFPDIWVYIPVPQFTSSAIYIPVPQILYH